MASLTREALLFDLNGVLIDSKSCLQGILGERSTCNIWKHSGSSSWPFGCGDDSVGYSQPDPCCRIGSLQEWLDSHDIWSVCDYFQGLHHCFRVFFLIVGRLPPHTSAIRMFDHVNLPLPSVFFSGDSIGWETPVIRTYFPLSAYIQSVEKHPPVLDCLDRSDE